MKLKRIKDSEVVVDEKEYARLVRFEHDFFEMQWNGRNVLHDFMGDNGTAVEVFGIGHEIIEKFFMFVADTEHFISSSMYLNQYMRAISVFWKEYVRIE